MLHLRRRLCLRRDRAMSERPTVFVCGGSHCSDTKTWRKLCDDLDGYASVREVRCQKICDGPVCGTALNGTLIWFAEVDGPRARQDLREVIGGAKITKRLRRRIAAKRSGRMR